MVGTIRHRLLVNSWLDPDEISPLLPEGIRPHVGANGGVVAGCCLIEIAAQRLSPGKRQDRIEAVETRLARTAARH